MPSRALFISFEGGEGSGKTTQINRLADILTKKNLKVITTREPGGTPEGEKIRSLLVQREGGDWTPMAECLLLYSARAMHIEKVILPQLEKGHIVISDRFSDSTLAYQGYGRGLPIEQIVSLDQMVSGGLKPDITFILDIAPETGLKRSGRRLAAEELHIRQTEDRYENLDIGFHSRIRKGFLDIAAKDPRRCFVLDAARGIDEIAKDIEMRVSAALSNN